MYIILYTAWKPKSHSEFRPYATGTINKIGCTQKKFAFNNTLLYISKHNIMDL